jgi:hypothetical protein
MVKLLPEHSWKTSDDKFMSGKIHIPAVIVSFLLFALILLSCSIERKIAREYIRNDTTRSVLVISPDFIFKTSLKSYEIDSAENLDEWALDSMLWESSLFLKYISDSLFLDYYFENYYAEMEALGFAVYKEDSLFSFLSGKNNAYIVNLAQLELEEYVMPIEEYEQFGEYLYYEVIDLNAINVNSWFEISRVNYEEDKALFFTSHYLTDEMHGAFRYYYFTGDVTFSYDIDTMLVEEIYKLGALIGHTYAAYTFDYLLNKYIDKRMDEEGNNRSDIYFHYNRQKNYLAPAKENERFIPLE